MWSGPVRLTHFPRPNCYEQVGICRTEVLSGLVYWVLNRSNVLMPGGRTLAVLGHSLGKCVGKRPLGAAAVVP